MLNTSNISISDTGHHSLGGRFSASQPSPYLLHVARVCKLISSKMRITMAVSRSILNKQDVQNVCILPGISKGVKHCGGGKQVFI